MFVNVESTSPEWAHAAELLGGHKVLRVALESPLVAHRLISIGMPGAALHSIISDALANSLGHPRGRHAIHRGLRMRFDLAVRLHWPVLGGDQQKEHHHDE